MAKVCEVCNTEFTKRRPNTCQTCYFKKRHQEKYEKKLRKCISCDKEFYLGHNVYCETCKENILKCEDKHRIYFGRKFYKSINGYWVCSKARLPWAHRWVWINHHGEIPKGFDIHHIDRNKDNNEIENLMILNRVDHLLEHSKEEKDKEILRKRLDDNRHLAHKWLRSDEGRKTLSISIKKAWKVRKTIKKQCETCNQDYDTYQSWSRFCSNACDRKWRRDKGLYLIEEICPICDNRFKKGKYSSQIFCSISCGAKNSARKRIKKTKTS